MRVVDETPDPSVEKRKPCSKCGVTLAYVPDDIKRYSGTDIGGGSDGREWIDCPKCGGDTTIRSW